MSFTLGSHIAMMIAMFVSPSVAVSVAMGTTLGFLLAGFPIVVVLRALSHVIWAYLGASYLKKHNNLFSLPMQSFIFNASIALLHAIGEMIIVIPFYLTDGIDASAFITMVFGLVGVGTIIHSFADFIISTIIWKALCKNSDVSSISNIKNINLLKKA